MSTWSPDWALYTCMVPKTSYFAITEKMCRKINTIVVNVTKLFLTVEHFFSLTLRQNKLRELFSKFFKASQIFANKTGAYPCGAANNANGVLVLFANIRLARKNLFGTNSLDILCLSISEKEEQSSISTPAREVMRKPG